jgi:hypothetical protein
MNGKFSLASLASIAGLTLSLLLSAQGRSGYAFGKDHGWRDSRRAAERRYYKARGDDDDQGEDWNDDDRDSGYYGQGEDRNDDDYRDSGYYRDDYARHYARRLGRISVVVGDPGYGGYRRYGYEDYGNGRPRGWDRGRKKGWRGCDLPPGQAKKYGCRSNSFLDFYGGR